MMLYCLLAFALYVLIFGLLLWSWCRAAAVEAPARGDAAGSER